MKEKIKTRSTTNATNSSSSSSKIVDLQERDVIQYVLGFPTFLFDPQKVDFEFLMQSGIEQEEAKRNTIIQKLIVVFNVPSGYCGIEGAPSIV